MENRALEHTKARIIPEEPCPNRTKLIATAIITIELATTILGRSLRFREATIIERNKLANAVDAARDTDKISKPAEN
jgi:hypothetical protein